VKRHVVAALAATVTIALVGVPAAAIAVVGGWDGSSLYYPFANDGTDPATDSNLLRIDSGATRGLYNETWINSGASKPAWDSSWVVQNPAGGPALDCDSTTADRLAPTDPAGGVTLVCAPETWATSTTPVTVVREFRVFGDGMTVRMRLTVTNPGGAAVTGAAFEIEDNFYCDGWTNVEWSTTGGSNIALWAAGGTDATGHVVGAGDLVYVLDAPGDVFSGGIGCPTTLVARGSAGAAVAPTQGGSSFGGDAAGHAATDVNVTVFTLPALAPGASTELVVLTRYYHFAYAGTEADTKANALVQTTAAISAAENEHFRDFAVAGIASPVANWAPAAAPPAPAPAAAPGLPDTGVALNPWTLALGFGTVLIGSIMVAVARPKAARRH
jgi:hypothetical protein